VHFQFFGEAVENRQLVQYKTALEIIIWAHSCFLFVTTKKPIVFQAGIQHNYLAFGSIGWFDQKVCSSSSDSRLEYKFTIQTPQFCFNLGGLGMEIFLYLL
jgi:hypothetical protein